MTTPSPDYRLIPLTQGQFAKVSPRVFEALSIWKWCAHWSPTTQSYYAYRPTSSDGRNERVLMHREILGLAPGDPRKADHRDRDTLNNADENLRIATTAENAMNCKRYSNNKSGFKGVSLHKDSGRWQAAIRLKGKQKYLGLFSEPEAAYAAYCEASTMLHGEFGRRA